jgi:hypothetical protein
MQKWSLLTDAVEKVTANKTVKLEIEINESRETGFESKLRIRP